MVWKRMTLMTLIISIVSLICSLYTAVKVREISESLNLGSASHHSGRAAAQVEYLEGLWVPDQAAIDKISIGPFFIAINGQGGITLQPEKASAMTPEMGYFHWMVERDGTIAVKVDRRNRGIMHPEDLESANNTDIKLSPQSDRLLWIEISPGQEKYDKIPYGTYIFTRKPE